jgi:hypothetical protein
MARLSADRRCIAAGAAPLLPACSKGAGLPESVSVKMPIASGSTLPMIPISTTMNNPKTMLQV